MSRVRTLIVDDSPTMRSLIAAVLRRDPEIEVVGQAGDPLEARQAIKSLDPDVVTLDIEMPNMSGLEFLEKIMRLRPTPVIMVSTLTQAGAEATLEALEIGAFDCIAKPSTGGIEAFAELPTKVKAAAKARIRHGLTGAAQARPDRYVSDGRLVAIGSSTGGVEALINILQGFPKDCPPTLITQHMPATFTKSFAARLDRSCAPVVTEAVDGEPIQRGHVYLAPGGVAHLEVSGATQWRCRLRESEPVNGHRPSVDVLFRSVAAVAGARALGVILTGMGGDGGRGLLAMRQAGARTLGQDEATCVVYGMPKVAHELGAVERQLPLSAIGAEILNLCSAERAERA
jgi:two-component system chemotaxis response regulator CheB